MALLIGAKIYSKLCHLCFELTKKQLQNPLVWGNKMVKKHRCPKNFTKTCSSKSMESLGGAGIVQQLITRGNNIFLHEIVINDDAATMKAIQR
eukprot:10368579-Ditylum_brightwellii.AAC.1